MIANQIIETNLWRELWLKINKSIEENQLSNNLAQNSESNCEAENNTSSTNISSPDWTLLSPTGYQNLLHISTRMFTMSTQNCVTLIAKDDLLMFDTLSYMISDNFLSSFKQR